MLQMAAAVRTVHPDSRHCFKAMRIGRIRFKSADQNHGDPDNLLVLGVYLIGLDHDDPQQCICPGVSFMRCTSVTV
jgi:hypothetical protein